MGWFSGGIASVIGDVAKEWITTDKESAEAKAIMVKTLDPNGLMRAQISKDVFLLYKIYIGTMLLLLLLEYFGVSIANPVDALRVAGVTAKLVALFVPITSMVTVIVAASFGVNYANVKQGK